MQIDNIDDSYQPLKQSQNQSISRPVDATHDYELSGAPEAMSFTAAAEPSSSSKGQRSKSPTMGIKPPASVSSPSILSSSRRISATAKAASPPTTLSSGSQKSGKSSS